MLSGLAFFPSCGMGHLEKPDYQGKLDVATGVMIINEEKSEVTDEDSLPPRGGLHAFILSEVRGLNSLVARVVVNGLVPRGATAMHSSPRAWSRSSLFSRSSANAVLCGRYTSNLQLHTGVLTERHAGTTRVGGVFGFGSGTK